MTTRQKIATLLTIVLTIAVSDGRAGGSAEVKRVLAPEHLSATGLYEPGTLRIAARNLPFEPQYPLWTDGAEKSRWIYLPPGAKIDATDPARWTFPIGTRLWKEFSFGGHKVETRMLWRATAAEWVFATYVWNEDQTDAFLAPDGGLKNRFVLAGGARYSIPGQSDCRACHESGGTPVLGFNALQLSDDRDPLAPHARPLTAATLTIRSLARMDALQPRRPELVRNPPRIAARTPRERAALGYLSTNCGSCHNERGPLSSIGLYLQHDLERNQAGPVFRTAVNVAGDYVTPGTTPEISRRIAPGSPGASAILYRMGSRRPSSQMPPLGTAVVDDEGLALVRAWIEELPAPEKAAPAAVVARHTPPPR